METLPWNEWLGVLKREGKLLETVPFAVRNFSWSMEVAMEGDFSGYALEGRLRANPDSATILADMTVTGPVGVDGFSVWTVSLPGTGGTYNTAGLPSDSDYDGATLLPLALILTPPSAAGYLLAGGTFTLLGVI